MLDAARVPEKPASPNRPVFSGIAFLLEAKRNLFLGEWEPPPGTLVPGRVPKMPTENPQA